jgi:DNA-directed RNA polymerases I, II, and III subunit RPABC2
MEALSDDEVSVSSLVSQEDDDKNEPKDTEVDDLVSDSEQLDDEDDHDEASVQSDDVPNSSIEQPDVESAPLNYSSDYDDDSDDYDSDDDDYLQKLDDVNKKNIVKEFHPELLQHNHYEIEALTRIVRNQQGQIVDPLHKTIPFITKYERARILGERAKQINMGAKPLTEIGPEIIDGYLIAEKEFSEKKIPFIVKRPLPNGGCEYWKFKDLEAI